MLRAMIFCALSLVPCLTGLPVSSEVSRAAVEAALPRIAALAERATEAGTVPGIAIAIVHDDEVVFLRGFGLRQVDEAAPVTPDTVFPIASLSKPLAATVLASLVGDGLFDWDTPVNDLVGEVHFHDPAVAARVTLRDLLSHRSGLSGPAGMDLDLIGYSQGEILARLVLLPPAGAFRASYAYSNFGFTLGAVSAAVAADTPWEALMEARLYDPLGMTRTSSRFAGFLSAANRVAMHTRIGGSWYPAPDSAAAIQAIPAGGVSSTARDLSVWMRVVLAAGRLDGTEVVNAEALAETFEPAVYTGLGPLTGQPSFYGIGWSVDRDANGGHLTHSGAFTSGVRSLVDLMPEERLGIVVLANGFPTAVPEGIAISFFDLVFTGQADPNLITELDGMFAAHHAAFVSALSGPLATSPSSLQAALPLAIYAGVYSNDYVGDAMVSLSDEGLELALGPGRVRRYPLVHHNGNVFYFRPLSESPDLLLPVVFTVGTAVQATGLTFGYIGGTSHNWLPRVEAPDQ